MPKFSRRKWPAGTPFQLTLAAGTDQPTRMVTVAEVSPSRQLPFVSLLDRLYTDKRSPSSLRHSLGSGQPAVVIMVV
jgi:hypothetical protein